MFVPFLAGLDSAKQPHSLSLGGSPVVSGSMPSVGLGFVLFSLKLQFGV